MGKGGMFVIILADEGLAHDQPSEITPYNAMILDLGGPIRPSLSV